MVTLIIDQTTAAAFVSSGSIGVALLTRHSVRERNAVAVSRWGSAVALASGLLISSQAGGRCCVVRLGEFSGDGELFCDGSQLDLAPL